jgi:hypothetical protein
VARPLSVRFGGIDQIERCLDGARITTAGFDGDGDLVVDAPTTSPQ